MSAVASELVGKWVVALRDIAANDEQLVGPYRFKDKAERVATRLRRDIDARAAGHLLEVVVRWVRPGLDLEEMRDEMLRDLDRIGLEYRHPAPGGEFGSWAGES